MRFGKFKVLKFKAGSFLPPAKGFTSKICTSGLCGDSILFPGWLLAQETHARGELMERGGGGGAELKVSQ